MGGDNSLEVLWIRGGEEEDEWLTRVSVLDL